MPPAILHRGLIPGSGLIQDNTKRTLELQYAPPPNIDSQIPHSLSKPDRLHQVLASRSISSSSPDVQASGRSLPSRDVTEETFDNAYVSFIMYCNPSVPVDTNPEELKKILRSPPKSDGKNFSTYVLFQLIRKLESKELKTWAQLALELGVEPPALDKGQSAQKVQQYAVRLKVSLP